MSNRPEEPAPGMQELPGSSMEHPDDERVRPPHNLQPGANDDQGNGTETPEGHDALDDGSGAGAPEGTAGGSTLENPADEPYVYIKRESVRRRPKYAHFATIGGLIGLVGALIAAQLGSISTVQDYSRVDLSIVLVGLGVPLAILISLIIALLLDRDRRSR